MKDVLLKELPIGGLEYVFKPPGLPLIVKTSKEAPSTSILVRGGPGTGKSTLATALVHAIAKEHGGTAVYLTTEFVPTEILYKARLLGLPDRQVMAWDDTGRVPEPGTLLVEHLLRLKHGVDVTNSAERKLAAIEAVWDLLNPDEPRGNHALSVRAVAIDAFGLPDSESEESALRNDLLALVQTLEGMGISTVLIEEVGGGASHWLPFITDIVFELSLAPDPDTGELIRKLTCPKSRYAVSLPGPHDYGLEDGKPRLWPDLLAVLHGIEPTVSVSQPGFFLPLNEDTYLSCKSGIVMVAPIGDRSLLDLQVLTPGSRGMRVYCGPLTRVEIPGSHGVFAVPASEGPFSLGWGILRNAAASESNWILIQNLEFFLSRARSRSSVLHMLQALGDAGLFIMVHGREENLGPVASLAEYVSDGSKISGKLHRRLRPDRVRSASLWLHGVLTTHLPLESQKQEQYRQEGTPEQLAQQISWQLSLGEMPVESAHGSVKSRIESKDAGPLTPTLYLLGLEWDAAAWLHKTVSQAAQRARYQLRMGKDLGAAQTILSLSQESSFASVLPLWRGLCAIYGRNDVALSELEQDPHTAADPDALGLYLRALAVRDRVDDVTRVTTEARTQHALPPWFVSRLQADLRLESRNRDLLREAAERLEKLTDSGEMPDVHKAEVFYNLGIARDRLGQPDEARAAYQRALEINPRLQAATRRLENRG